MRIRNGELEVLTAVTMKAFVGLQSVTLQKTVKAKGKAVPMLN
jgi:hypothetical protein